MKTLLKSNSSYILLFCLSILYCGNVTSQISVPNPSVHFAFDTNNPGYESVSKATAVTFGDFTFVTDRFGNSRRAVTFNGKGSGIRGKGYNINNVHTISFWVKIDDPSTIPSGAIPFSPTDVKYEFYNWIDANNNILRGLGRKKATLGLNRYIPKNDGSRVPWYLWAYKPLQFNESGWHHIFIIQGEHYTRLIMYKPSTLKSYFYIWLGSQDFPVDKKLFIGGFSDNYPINGPIDDFKVYNVELTDEQIEYLHIAEYPFSRYVKIKNKNSGKYIVVEDASKDDGVHVMQHSTESGNGEWKLYYAGPNEYRIENLHSGKLMNVRGSSMAAGAEVIQYRKCDSENEIWIPECSNLDPKYFRLKSKSSGKYLSVFQNSTEDNYKLIQSNPGEVSEYWTFECAMPINTWAIEDGLYRLKNKLSGRYLSAKKGSEAVGDNLVQLENDQLEDIGYDVWYVHTYAGENGCYIINAVSSLAMKSQNRVVGSLVTQDVNTIEGSFKWQFINTGKENEYRLRNVESFYYAVVANALGTEGASIVQSTESSLNNDVWVPERVYYDESVIPEGTYKIRNDNSNKLMVVKDASKSDGAEIIQHEFGEDDSMWEVVHRKYGYVELINKNSQKFFVVKDASLYVGENIIQYGTHIANGLWKISKIFFNKGGTMRVGYTLKNANSQQYAVVRDASRDNFAPIIQYNSGEANKLWYFDKQTANAMTRNASGSEGNVTSDMSEPMVFVDCKNDLIQIYTQFNSPTGLILRIMDLAGRQVYEGEKNVDAGNNAVLINQFNKSLIDNNLYVISIRSKDGTFNFSTKVIMKR